MGCRDQCRRRVDTVINSSGLIEGRGFLDNMSYYELLKGPASWSCVPSSLLLYLLYFSAPLGNRGGLRGFRVLSLCCAVNIENKINKCISNH